MTNNDIALDMTDTSTRDKVLLLTAVHALAIEVATSMKASRHARPMDVARHFGFQGRSKAAALKFTVAKLQELDPDYTPGRSVQIALDK